MINKKIMLEGIPISQVEQRLRFENPWWETGKIEKDFDRMAERLYFNIFRPLAYEDRVRRAIVLMGPRRVGKTVLLHHIVRDFIANGKDPRKILYATIENPVYNDLSLEEIFRYGKEAAGEGRDPDEPWLVIFDEIQYCKNWEIHLKVLVDSYRQDKFIVSGSAAAALKAKSMESGAGRFTDFLLPPLTFHEYMALLGLDQHVSYSNLNWQDNIARFYTSDDLEKLNEHFIEYMNYGGYPEVIFSQTLRDNPGRYIRQDIIDKVLLRDLPSIYGIQDVQELNSLFTTIAYNSGNEYSYQSLSQQSGVPKNTLKKYISYLEAAFLVKVVRRVDQSGKRFQRDNFIKIYLTNPSLRSALFTPLTPFTDELGNMVETVIYSQWMHRDWFTPWFARWERGEVDMVGISERNLSPTWALEIKWTNRYWDHPHELKSLLSFCKANKLDRAIVTTINKQGVKQVDGIDLQFFPAASYAYTVGANTLIRKT